jgi:hypothetical protein
MTRRKIYKSNVSSIHPSSIIHSSSNQPTTLSFIIGAIRTDHFERGSPLAQINNYDSIKIFDRRLPPPLPNHQLCFVKLLTAVRITGHSLLVPGPPIHKQTSPVAFDSMSYRLASPGLDLMYLFYIVFLCHRAKLPRLNDFVSICH